MLSCKEVARVCSDELERPLGLGERAGMHMHLVMCRACTNYRRQLQTLRLAMQTYAQGNAPAAGDVSGERDESL